MLNTFSATHAARRFFKAYNYAIWSAAISVEAIAIVDITARVDIKRIVGIATVR